MFSDGELRRQSIDTLKRRLRGQLGGYRIAIKNIQARELLFRGVRLTHEEGCPDRISRISHPPLENAESLVKELGRVNRIGQSMFYCSKGAPAVFYELQAKQGEFFVLSGWEVTEPLWMHNLGYYPQALQQMGAHKHSIAMREQLINSIPNETKKNRKLRHRLSKAFTVEVPAGEEHKYKQSIAIGELFMDGSPIPQQAGGPRINKAAGIVYPAMKLHGDADNLVILPEIVESSLRIKSAQYVRIEAADEKLSSYTFLTVSIATGFIENKIVWRDDFGTEDDRRCHIAFENGEWVQRDGYNRIYGRPNAVTG